MLECVWNLNIPPHDATLGDTPEVVNQVAAILELQGMQWRLQRIQQRLQKCIGGCRCSKCHGGCSGCLCSCSSQGWKGCPAKDRRESQAQDKCLQCIQEIPKGCQRIVWQWLGWHNEVCPSCCKKEFCVMDLMTTDLITTKFATPGTHWTSIITPINTCQSGAFLYTLTATTALNWFILGASQLGPMVLGFMVLGFTANKIGLHSLCISAAMAMVLLGTPVYMAMLLDWPLEIRPLSCLHLEACCQVHKLCCQQHDQDHNLFPAARCLSLTCSFHLPFDFGWARLQAQSLMSMKRVQSPMSDTRTAWAPHCTSVLQDFGT